jgi:hypothetical protein
MAADGRLCIQPQITDYDWLWLLNYVMLLWFIKDFITNSLCYYISFTTCLPYSAGNRLGHGACACGEPSPFIDRSSLSYYAFWIHCPCIPLICLISLIGYTCEIWNLNYEIWICQLWIWIYPVLKHAFCCHQYIYVYDFTCYILHFRLFCTMLNMKYDTLFESFCRCYIFLSGFDH